jgi:hypothetical protein
MSTSKSNRRASQGSPETRARKSERKQRRKARRRRNRIIAIGAALVLVALASGAGLYMYNQGEDRIRDLSAVGRGVPAVVQVHDATCPVCTELRANVDRIDHRFSDDELLIRIADVHTDAGVEFAARYTTARRATLLFIDGGGELVEVHTGALEPRDLEILFERHSDGELTS